MGEYLVKIAMTVGWPPAAVGSIPGGPIDPATAWHRLHILGQVSRGNCLGISSSTDLLAGRELEVSSSSLSVQTQHHAEALPD